MYLIEFSKIYKRLMELEHCLKDKMIFSVNSFYKEKSFSAFKSFFERIEEKEKYSKIVDYNYKTKTGRKIFIIKEIKNNTNLDNSTKFQKIIHCLYLSDFLKLLTKHKLFYKNKKIKNAFYVKNPDFNMIDKYSIYLINLRNYIMHFNYQDYLKDKQNYLDALKYFEIHLGCSNYKLHSINLDSDQSINAILEAIKSIMPELFDKESNITQKDRTVCDIFDDLAFINGSPYNKLPALWSILRQKYDLESKITEKNEKQEMSPGQICLSF